jgi:L-2-hydroxycarboxylate dehydrogenase (NAD+)
MNLPPEEFVTVTEDRELAFLGACFEHVGVSAEHAAAMARLLTNSDLRGVRSHGIAWAPGYCRKFRDGELNTSPNIRVVHEIPTTTIIDGDGFLGYVPTMMATQAAIAKAKQVGIGMGLVRHIGHNGAAGHYTRVCRDAGCIGFAVQGFRGDGNRRNQDPKPPSTYTGFPPMSFSIPASQEPAIVLDMVAHVVSGYNQPEHADLPERIPATFFKAMGLVATANLLGGALTGFTQPEGDEIAAKFPGATMGGMVLAIDVASMVPEEVFGAEVDRYIRDVCESFAPMPGQDEVVMPGHVEERILAKHLREGIRYGEREQTAARQMHDDWGVPLPWDKEERP